MTSNIKRASSRPSLLRRVIRKLSMTKTRRFVIENKLTYLSPSKLDSLVRSVRLMEKNNIEGTLIEAGCALGGSSLLIAESKAKTRPQFVYDVFGMIPAPSENDDADVHERYEAITSGKSSGIGGDVYYGYRDDLLEFVTGNFEKCGFAPKQNHISLIQGMVQETMSIDHPVALAHIDVDWYDPVLHCLDQIWPHLSIGGLIILDDYADWSGCRKAVDFFFKSIDPDQFHFDETHGHLIVRKCS